METMIQEISGRDFQIKILSEQLKLLKYYCMNLEKRNILLESRNKDLENNFFQTLTY